MNRFLLAVLLLLGLVSCAGNKNASCDLEASTVKHFLWKVSDEDSFVWILGSVHFADSTFYPLDSVIETAFVHAEELAVEINISDDSVSSEISMQSMKQGMLPEGMYLQDVLPFEVWTKFDSICTSWKISSSVFRSFKPWLAATSLSAVAIERMGINPALGVDAVLLDRASMEGKVIVGLETADEQVNAVADTSDSDSAGIYYLKSTLREISELDSMVAKIILAWKTGDENLLRRVMNDEDENRNSSEEEIMNRLEEKVYTNRNVKMANSIAQFLTENRNVFVVIGAAHLALEKCNVIDLLRTRGFKIERF